MSWWCSLVPNLPSSLRLCLFQQQFSLLFCPQLIPASEAQSVIGTSWCQVPYGGEEFCWSEWTKGATQRNVAMIRYIPKSLQQSHLSVLLQDQ
ncbi:hypothetical protein Y1Q_0010946 [Alligator mississippiensis]|uniref:Uncharacterized protein n=1 Tax=Alligator mississippiensis TaxID=8496 RepID=A0A151MEH2_ALLMI|nr:hypothetical protein Y1Q_0010946 [Alligator mississippiensis]